MGVFWKDGLLAVLLLVMRIKGVGLGCRAEGHGSLNMRQGLA